MIRRGLAAAIAALVLALLGAGQAAAVAVDPAEGSGGAESSGGVGAEALAPSDEPDDAVDSDTGSPESYPGDPVAEAKIVAQEDRRLIDVDLVSKGVLVPELDVTRPFRVTGTAVSTLVLPSREAPYTLDELHALSSQSVESLGDGVYELNENLAVLKGATLDIRALGALTLRLASRAEGFVSIVTLGGSLVMRGDASAPATITSWDATTGTPDTTTADGRAYIRAMGGQVSLTDANFSDLGFWSGNTGGIALTGLVQNYGVGLAPSGGADPAATASAEPEAAPSPDPSASPDPAGIVTTTDEGIVEELSQHALIPQGVTAYVANISVQGNAFGLFATNATSIEIHDSRVSGSLVDGIVFHRQVQHSTVESTDSSNNAGDGFRISRGSDAIILDGVSAVANGRNGITINASPLADGPSAVGLPTTVYGDHVVRNAVATQNAAAGISVYGGHDIAISRTRVEDSPFGIIVAQDSQGVRIEESTVTESAKQGIALRDGVTGTVISTGISGAEIGIYSRESVVDLQGNVISDVSSHGISIVGEAEGTTISGNTISGRGSSPIDTARSEHAKVDRTNVIEDWSYQSFGEVVVDNVKRPLTLMWALLATLLLFTAFSGLRQRRRGFQAPYRDRTPLSQYSAGLVDPTTIPGAKPPLAKRPSMVPDGTSDGELPRRRRRAPEHETVGV